MNPSMHFKTAQEVRKGSNSECSMENKSFKKVTVFRPKDESFEAYKAWMTELAKNLTTDPIKWREEEWIANWKKFWKEKPSD
jgi:hypothetical protein